MKLKKIEYEVINNILGNQNNDIKIYLLDGNQKKAFEIDVVTHGETVIETVKGKGKRVRWNKSSLFD
jgi:hypothetical protein